MSDRFTICGRIVTHTMRPCFQMIFAAREDGGWEGRLVPGSLDAGTNPDAGELARLSRKAGDFFAANAHRDWVQEVVIARAAALGLTAHAIAKRTGDAVSEDHIVAYLKRRASMGSHKLQHVLRAIGVTLASGD